MTDEEFHLQVVARLDIVIRLLLAGTEKDGRRNITEMASQLHEMGLSPAEIGAILGKQSNYISASLKARKRAKRKVKQNG